MPHPGTYSHQPNSVQATLRRLAAALAVSPLGEHVTAEALADHYGSTGAREVGEGYVEEGEYRTDPETVAHGRVWLAVAFTLSSLQL
ncbi:MAG: hypothetical protein GWN58_32965 [Anaerolineae bacterium]|nr:hypothetical protein [Thermoplasmata archaeon]NIV34087.1 hypothetical protein [Anaerolineae bacterium]NIY05938.1 hypothetical protein [Thermoplasmata archaeon]